MDHQDLSLQLVDFSIKLELLEMVVFNIFININVYM